MSRRQLSPGGTLDGVVAQVLSLVRVEVAQQDAQGDAVFRMALVASSYRFSSKAAVRAPSSRYRLPRNRPASWRHQHGAQARKTENFRSW
jgi:hypothetical protein